MVATFLVAAIMALWTGSASAQPVLVNPANGASFARNAPIPFTVDLPSGANDAEIEVSTSSAVSADGALASPESGFYAITVGSPGTSTWMPSEQAVGTYYWQADSFVCDSVTCGYEYSPVQSFVLTALPAPTAISPANGATAYAGAATKFVFTPNAQPEDRKLYVVFSPSNAVGADGVLSQPAVTTGDLTSEEGLTADTNISLPIPHSINVPGTIYWQAVRVNCDDNPTAPCNVAGAVRELILKKKPPPPLHLQVTAGMTVRIGYPRIAWNVQCSEACSGNVTIKAIVHSGGKTVGDGLFDIGPRSFTIAGSQEETFRHTYSGTVLKELARAITAHGYVQLNATVTATATDGGGTATAERSFFVRPNPPPPPPPAPKTAPPPARSSTIDVHDFNGNVLAVSAFLFADPATPANQFEVPSSGDRLVAIGLHLTDDGPGTVSDDANNDTVLVGKNGQAYTASFDDVRGCTNFDYGAFTLFDGESETGCVVFELPKSVGISRVAFSLGEDTAQWIDRSG